VMDMDRFRADVARVMNEEDDLMKYTDWPKEDRDALTNDVADAVLREKVKVLGANGDPVEVTMKQAVARIANRTLRTEDDMEKVLKRLDELNAE
jgi:hypothetical protein